ncbi:hypothetical protein [Streptomyces sp. NPDC050264]|uniref:hypothetical protein n=1 Tax=Streptomyces sp. NPDC050264 TaxID=3155038 RepID=UPI00341D8D95
MTDPLVPPEEPPPAEGSIAEERADGGLREHPGIWLWLIAAGAVLVAAFFLARLAAL